MGIQLEKLKADLQLAASLDELLKDGRNKSWYERLKSMPVAKMMDQVQYMDSQMLPAVKKKKGETSADYQFFQSIRESILWAIIMRDRYDRIEGINGSLKLENVLLRERATALEKELLKFETIEDLYATSAIDNIMKGVKQRAENLLNKTNKK